MRPLRLPLIATIALLFIVNAAVAQEHAPLSDRVVAYEITGNYDAKTHVLDGVETLTYRNLTGQPLDRFPFHLYLNAFQPTSTFMKETNRDKIGSRFSYDADPKFHGSNIVTKFEVVGIGDGKHKLTFPTPQNVTEKMKFIAPDDGNGDDKTVFEVQLPEPVSPGGEVTFRIAFQAKFPEVFARTGYKRDFIMGAQWFPKVGVWWQGKWNCHQFHRNTEFFADFGTFDVTLTLPQNFVAGATGVQTAEKNNGNGTRTLTWHAEDVHDFAWTADPNYKVVEETITTSAGPVKARLLMQPGHMDSAPRYMQALKGTMQHFDQWYGQYPYPIITVVDPPHGGDRAGGMEYPTLITAGTTWFMPKAGLIPEMVVEHEFGHQYWYGMVATNEFENAWLDEGINTYTEIKIMDDMYGRQTSMFNWRGIHAGDRGLQRLAYLSAAEADPMDRNGWEYQSNGTYGSITYGKTGTVLLSLEQFIGEDKMQQAMRTWFERYRFKHPTKDDFYKTVNEVAGQDLSWFWDQAVKGTAIVDYEVQQIASVRADLTVTGIPKPPKKGETPYDNYVMVHRKGDFIAPVQLEVKFDNGEVVHDTWDGKDRWHRFQWNKKAKIVSAEIDYNHQLQLDRDFYNNSNLVQSDNRAARKLAGYWTFLVQWFAQMLAWLT